MLAASALLAFFLAPAMMFDDLEQRYADYTRAESVATRCAALEALAGIQPQPDGPASSAIAAALAKALDDPSALVRKRCIELLAPFDEPDVVLPALVGAAQNNVEKRLARASKQRELFEDMLGESTSGTRGAQEPAPAREDPLQKGKRIAKEVQELDALEGELVRERDALVVVFAAKRDDRSVEGLTRLIAASSYDSSTDPLFDALLAIGTAPAIETAVGLLVRFEEMLARIDTEIARTPKNAPMAASHQKLKTERTAWAETARERVARFAAALDLPKPPSRILPSGNWSRWATRAAALLPKSVATAPAAKQ